MSSKKPDYMSYINERKRWERKGYVLDKKLKKSEYEGLYYAVKKSGSHNVVRDMVSAETWISRDSAKALQKRLTQLRKDNKDKFREAAELFINPGNKKNTYKITQKDILRANIYSKEFRMAFVKALGNQNTPASDTTMIHGTPKTARQQAFFVLWDLLGNKHDAEESFGY